MPLGTPNGPFGKKEMIVIKTDVFDHSQPYKRRGQDKYYLNLFIYSPYIPDSDFTTVLNF